MGAITQLWDYDLFTFLVAAFQRRQQVRSMLRSEEQIALEQLGQELELEQQGPGLEQLVAR